MPLTVVQRRAFAALVVLAVTLALFADATEDVAHRNGPVLQDAARLRFFTADRSDLLVHVAKVVTDFGGTFMLVAIALGAGVLLWRRGLPIAVVCSPLIALDQLGDHRDHHQAPDRPAPAPGRAPPCFREHRVVPIGTRGQ